MIRVDTVTKTDVDIKKQIHKQYPSLFKGLGNVGEEYEIKLKPDAHALFTACHVPLPLCPKVKDELEKMEAMGVITKVDEPTPWCAGMVVVPKKNRMC